jgi:hypothetical protein
MEVFGGGSQTRPFISAFGLPWQRFFVAGRAAQQQLVGMEDAVLA